MIVLDASVVLEVLLRLPRARGIETRIFAAGESLHVPHLLDIEVAQVLRRYARMGDADPADCADALLDLSAFPLTRHPHGLLMERVWDLRDNLTAYDAVYVALAEALDAPLLTRDRRLANAPGTSATIELV